MSGSKKQKLDPLISDNNDKYNKKLKTGPDLQKSPTTEKNLNNESDKTNRPITKANPGYIIEKIIKNNEHSEISTIFKDGDYKKEKESLILKKYKQESTSIHCNVLRELFFYKTYTHPNIPKIFGVRRDEKTGYYEIIIENAGISFENCMYHMRINTKNVSGISSKIGAVIGRILLGFHVEGIYHVDVRIPNIMVADKSEDIKLIDFDNIKGTFDFKNEPWEKLISEKVVPPEIENNFGLLSESSDVFILGKSLFELIYCAHNCYPGTYYSYYKPSYSENIKDMISFLRKVKDDFDKKTQVSDINLIDCIISMITFEPYSRPKLSNCIEVFDALLEEFDVGSSIDFKQIKSIPTTLTLLPALNLDLKVLDSAFLINDRKTVIDLPIRISLNFNFSLKEILVSYDALLTFLSNCGKIISLQNIQMYSIIGLFLVSYFLNGNSDNNLNDIAKQYANIIFSSNEIQTMTHNFFAVIDHRIITRKVNKKILKDFEKFIPTIMLITNKEKELLKMAMSDNNYITQNRI